MTPEKKADIAERYGWREGEREALQRDISERQRRIKSEETLAWCRARNAERAEAERQAPQAGPTVTKSEGGDDGQHASVGSWIKDQIRTSRKASEKLAVRVRWRRACGRREKAQGGAR